MLIKEVLIEAGNPGTNGEKIEIDGMCTPNVTGEVPVFLNFDRSLPPIGSALIYKKDGAIYGNIKLFGTPPEGTVMYPCAGISYEPEDRKKNVVNKCTINNVGLCIAPNADLTIPPIKF